MWVAPLGPAGALLSLQETQRHIAELQQERSECRWIGSLTEQAEMLRVRLDREDPWTWSGACAWCANRDLVSGWRNASSADFAGHPSFT